MPRQPREVDERLNLSSELHQIERAVEFVHNHLLDLDPDSADAVALAVRECVANAILHGNHGDPGLRVTLRVLRRETALTIEVTDEGQGFQPAEVPDPTRGDGLLRPHGRGLFLMRRLMDDVEVRDRGGGRGTVVTLRRSSLSSKIRPDER